MSRCIGCGVKLQSIDPNKEGYVPEIKLIEEGEQVYCKRCYDIKHHNETYDYKQNYDEYYQKISFIKDTKSLIILIIDALNIHSSFIPNLKDYVGNNEVLLIINKIDVLPKSIKLNHLEMYAKNIAINEGLNVKSVMMVSSLKQTNIEKVINKIKDIKYYYNKQNKRVSRFDDAYVLGCSSVGKSTFINSILKYLGVCKEDLITTSPVFSTTLDFIKINLDRDSFIYDTPGIINPKSYFLYLDFESIKKTLIHKYIKNIVYQLNPDQTIFIGSLVRIDFLEGKNISISTFISNDIHVHRTKTVNADEVYEKNKGELLNPPVSIEELERIKEYKEYIFEYNSPSDLELPGIGFVHLTGENVKIKVSLFKNVVPFLDRSFI